MRRVSGSHGSQCGFTHVLDKDLVAAPTAAVAAAETAASAAESTTRSIAAIKATAASAETPAEARLGFTILHWCERVSAG